LAQQNGFGSEFWHILLRLVKTYRFGSAKWFWLRILAQFVEAGQNIIGLAQQNGFGSEFLHSLLRLVKTYRFGSAKWFWLRFFA